ncbi:MAG: alanine racemase [Aquificaceae bacterium]|nr:MAG: alanine racemase [Aquificaceae bacterium]
MKRSARVTLHPKALQHNLQQARLAAPHSKVLAVIKANAYGHGVLEVAQALQTADGYAVSCIPEAVALRESGTQHPILILQGHQNLDDLRIASELQFRVVIHSTSQLTFLDQLGDSKVQVALKLDTGMHRLGIAPQDAAAIFNRLKNHKNIDTDIWLMTHLSCADDLTNSNTNTQLDIFNHNTNALPASRSIANSAGILGWSASHADWIRPGIMLYGSSPFTHEDNGREYYNLQAAMTLSAPLIAIHHFNKGEAIGYGASFHCPHDMQVGIVACGYADGYPRHAATGTPVSINNIETHTVGRVSMDMIAINMHTISAKVGDLVELWGTKISVDRVAHNAETISYELLCNAGNNCTWQ